MQCTDPSFNYFHALETHHPNAAIDDLTIVCTNHFESAGRITHSLQGTIKDAELYAIRYEAVREYNKEAKKQAMKKQSQKSNHSQHQPNPSQQQALQKQKEALQKQRELDRQRRKEEAEEEAHQVIDDAAVRDVNSLDLIISLAADTWESAISKRDLYTIYTGRCGRASLFAYTMQANEEDEKEQEIYESYRFAFVLQNSSSGRLKGY